MSKRAKISFVGISLLFFAIACDGGGGDSGDKEVLHLNEQDVTVADYRAYLQDLRTSGSFGINMICSRIKEMSIDDAVAYMNQGSGTTTTQLVTGATPKPSQKTEDASARRAAELVKEACAG